MGHYPHEDHRILPIHPKNNPVWAIAANCSPSPFEIPHVGKIDGGSGRQIVPSTWIIERFMRIFAYKMSIPEETSVRTILDDK